jgi:hypothetical protein
MQTVEQGQARQVKAGRGRRTSVRQRYRTAGGLRLGQSTVINRQAQGTAEGSRTWRMRKERLGNDRS